MMAVFSEESMKDLREEDKSRQEAFEARRLELMESDSSSSRPGGLLLNIIYTLTDEDWSSYFTILIVGCCFASFIGISGAYFNGRLSIGNYIELIIFADILATVGIVLVYSITKIVERIKN